MKPEITQIAEWIANGDISLSMATTTYGLDEAERERLAALLADRKAAHTRRTEHIRADLIENIKSEPWKYYTEAMATLIYGVMAGDEFNDPTLPLLTEFVNHGGKISTDELIEAGAVPQGWDIDRIESTAWHPETQSVIHWRQQPEKLREHHTDVLLLGASHSGRTTLLTCLTRQLLAMEGVEAESSTEFKPVDTLYPLETEKGTMARVDLCKRSERKRICLIDGGPDQLPAIVKLRRGDNTESERAMCELSTGKNSKILLIVIDSKILTETSENNILRRVLPLTNALTVLASDGKGKDGRKGCTMSRVRALGVIFSKSDCAPHDMSAERFMEENLSEFAATLRRMCQEFGINDDNANSPYVFKFSVGRHYAANTYRFNPETTLPIAEMILCKAAKQMPWNM